jgi:putative acetyltransferase
MTAIALRPFLLADAQRCLEIFHDSIEEIASEDYDADQREAWRARASDPTGFASRLTDALTLVATLDRVVAGFASLKGAEVLDMLYVDPAFSRRGVGDALIDALVRLAQARGALRVTSDVNDTARSLFERHGFIAQRRSLASVDDQWLANTTMTKTLANSEPTTRH